MKGYENLASHLLALSEGKDKAIFDAVDFFSNKSDFRLKYRK